VTPLADRASHEGVTDADFDYAAALAACARGDRSALREIYAREAGRLMGVALRIVRRREIADEVLHDAFLQIWQKAATYDPALGSGRGWIFSIVRHRALNSLRGMSRETLVEEAPLTEVEDDAPDPLERLVGSRDTEALARCLGELDESKRRCILLAYLDGLTHVEIAARLAAPLGTIKAWIRRGLASLKECMG
jgi:RNA polymerase sigma-70 factor (ECF subfamily)